MSYLSPYLEALGSDFTGGANFAVSGSATLPRSAPFSLHVQVQQFIHFKQRSFELVAHGKEVKEHTHHAALLLPCSFGGTRRK